MNTVKIKTEIVDGRNSYLVVAVIDGKEVLTSHSFHTQANKRLSCLVRDYGCVEK